MSEDFKKISKYAKDFIGKKSYSKISKIKDKREKLDLLKYIVISKLKLEILNIETKLAKNKSHILHYKVELLKNKLKLFETSFSESDFKVLLKNIKEINKDI